VAITAAGVLTSARQLGSAIGVAVFGTLLAGSFTSGMHHAVLIGAAATLAARG
jgi:DHA2 family methylenomycin A resistance protein-like MFS transporter